MANAVDYDLLIVGSGPGGYVAAIRAAQLGLKAAVIEKDKPGGVCLNIGCIPSKALIHQADLFRSIPALTQMGVEVDAGHLDYKKVQAKSKAAAEQLSRGVQFLLKKNKIDYIAAEVVKVRPQELETADGQVVKGKKILLATGSRPREIPGFEFDEKRILSSTGALQLQSLPDNMLILGSGAIGVEFAHILNAFGVKIHLVEMLDRILPLEDDETVEILHKSFKKRGMQIETATKAISQEYLNGKVKVTLEDSSGRKKTLEFDQVLVSAGRIPNTVGLGLEELGISLDSGGFIPVGDYYQTVVAGIYAIGDIVRTPLLAHVASREGEIAVEHMAGRQTARALDLLSIPAATYCEPQIASFGYTERLALEKDIPYKKRVFPFRGVGKAVAVSQAEGMIKILLDKKTEEIIGAHIVGPDATELIHELLLARSAELLPEDIMHMIHAHPTLSEGVLEAMRGAGEGAIHI